MAKLKLLDLLVKPMHRITRYPMLLKRLLTQIKHSQAAVKILESVVRDFESMGLQVNRAVKLTEAEFQLADFDAHLDVNNLSEVRLLNYYPKVSG